MHPIANRTLPPIRPAVRLLVMALWVALWVALLGGCAAVDMITSLFSRDDPPKTELKRLKVVAERGANLDSATAVDLVFVLSADAGKLLPKSAPEWFATRDSLRAQLAQQLLVTSLQVPPTYIIEEVSLPDGYSDAVGVIAYANYIPKGGQHPVNLTPYKKATLVLKAKAVAVEAH